MRLATRTLVFVAALWMRGMFVAVAEAGDTTELWVATTGSDTNPGTKEKPFQHLEAARDAIRGLKKSDGHHGGFTVWIRGGSYYRRETFDLTTDDSGTEAAPIVYRAFDREQVRLSGGRRIPRDWFQPVTHEKILSRLDPAVRDKVLKVELEAHQITDDGVLDLGRGSELFCNDRPMQLARWPNEGWALARRRRDKDTTANVFTFEYRGKPPNRWGSLDQVILHGFFHQDYRPVVAKLKQIDTQKRTMITDDGVGHGPASPRRFYALDILEELDQPGEWYLEHEEGVLYFLPPDDFQEATVVISMLNKPLVALRDTSHVTLRGLTLEASRQVAVAVEGGTHNLVAGCVVRNVLRGGINLLGGTSNGVLSCEIYDVGSYGVRMVGGDRTTLTPAGLYVENTHIHHFARLGRSYEPAVAIHGVGNRVAHNLIHDAPHSAILYQGNDHVIEFNTIHDVVLQTNDSGVLYSGFNWTCRGNVVRYNFFHDIPHPPGGYTMVVYLDDAHCSTKTFGNVFYKTHTAVYIGGGRDNVVENNIFIDCLRSVILDDRGLRWTFLNPDGDITDTAMYKKLTAVPYDKPPWSTRYPKLARILKERPRAPLGNTLKRNVSFRSGWPDFAIFRQSASKYHIDKPYMQAAENLVTDEAPGFVDAAHRNFQLKEDSVVYRKIPGLKKIPFAKIGLYPDEYRATNPHPKGQP